MSNNIFYTSKVSFDSPAISLFCLFASVDVVIPCAKCIAVDNGLPGERWREAVMNGKHLQTHMQCRLRQHISREHGLKAREKEAIKLRQFGKQLLCPFLHTRERKESTSEVLCTPLIQAYSSHLEFYC